MSNRFTKGRGLFGAIQIGPSNAVLKGVTYGTLSLVHGTVTPAVGIGTVSAALAGLAAEDVVIANVLTPTGGLALAGVKPASGTLTAYLVNPGTGTISPGTFTITYAHVDLT